MGRWTVFVLLLAALVLGGLLGLRETAEPGEVPAQGDATEG